MAIVMEQHAPAECACRQRPVLEIGGGSRERNRSTGGVQTPLRGRCDDGVRWVAHGNRELPEMTPSPAVRGGEPRCVRAAVRVDVRACQSSASGTVSELPRVCERVAVRIAGSAGTETYRQRRGSRRRTRGHLRDRIAIAASTRKRDSRDDPSLIAEDVNTAIRSHIQIDGTRRNRHGKSSRGVVGSHVTNRRGAVIGSEIVALIASWELCTR